MQLYYTGIQCKDLDESLKLYTEILGFEKIGPGSDDAKKDPLLASLIAQYEEEILPKLFGIDGKVEFRSQLIGLAGNEETYYNLFEWVSPKWVCTDPYIKANHCGLYRTQWATSDFYGLREKLEKFGCGFVSYDVDWMGGYMRGEKPSFTKHMGVLDPNGVFMQIKQVGDFVEGDPKPIKKILHREVNCQNIYRTVMFYRAIGGIASQQISDSRTMHIKTNRDPEYIDYLCSKNDPQLFHYDVERCEFKATIMNINGSLEHPEALDCFEWIVPRVYGHAYPEPNHIGMQRLCFLVTDLDDVRNYVRAIGGEVICEMVDIPETKLPGTNKKIKRGMSLKDPNGVFVFVFD